MKALTACLTLALAAPLVADEGNPRIPFAGSDVLNRKAG